MLILNIFIQGVTNFYGDIWWGLLPHILHAVGPVTYPKAGRLCSARHTPVKRSVSSFCCALLCWCKRRALGYRELRALSQLWPLWLVVLQAWAGELLLYWLLYWSVVLGRNGAGLWSTWCVFNLEEYEKVRKPWPSKPCSPHGLHCVCLPPHISTPPVSNKWLGEV